MIRFFKSPHLVRIFYPNLVWKLPAERHLYLTFDDGPDPQATPWLLAFLKKQKIKACFFTLGKKLEEHPDLVKQMAREGHTIGNHTYDHPDGWKTSASEYMKNVKKCDEILAKFGIGTALFRPPYGNLKRKQVQALSTKRIIMWSYLSWDFDVTLPTQKSLRELKKAKPGDILVFHDSSQAYPKLRKILPEIVEYYKSEGFKFDCLR